MDNNEFLNEIKEELSEEKINILVKEFIDLITDYEPLSLFKAISIQKDHFFNHQETIEQTVVNDFLIYTLSIYAGKQWKNKDLKVITCDTLNIIIKRFNEIRNKIIGYINFYIIDKNIISNANLYQSVYNRTFPQLAFPSLYLKLQSQGELLNEIYNLTLDDLFEGISNLIKASENLMELYEQKLLTDTNVKEFNDVYIPDYYDVEKITHWPIKLINDLTFSNGEAAHYFNRERYAGWFHVEMPYIEKPFILINGHSCVFTLNRFFDNFYRIIQQCIFSHGDSFKEQWNNNQKEVSENLPLEMLKDILPDATTYSNNYYRQCDGNWAENDGIVVYNNVLFLIEVKAGKYSPRSVILDPSSHENAYKDLIEKPIGQLDKIIRRLDEVGELSICDERHKEKLKIVKKDFKYIFALAIPLDALNEVALTYNNDYSNHGGNYVKTVIDFDDFFAYCCFFKTKPSLFFLHFMKERIMPLKIKNFRNSDEMNYLSYYIKFSHLNNTLNNFNNHDIIKKHEQTMVIIPPDYDELSDFFFDFPDGTAPRLNVTDFIYDLIAALDKCKDANKINLAFSILDLDDDNLKRIEDCTQEILRRQERNKKFSSILLDINSDKNFAPILLFCNPANEEYATRQKIVMQTCATVEAQNLDSLQYLVLKFENRKIISADCGIITSNNIINKNKEYIVTVNHIKKTIKEQSNLPSPKIGRNEMCPCGSGKKYKFCCGK